MDECCKFCICLGSSYSQCQLNFHSKNLAFEKLSVSQKNSMTELDLADSMWNCTETWNMFLQLDLQTHPAHLETVTADEAWTKWTWTGRSHVDLLSLWTEANNKLRHSEVTTSLPKVFAYISSGIVIATCLCLFLMSMWLLIRGLPKKAPRHSSVNEGCPTSWILFLCLTYTFIWFTTDQYVPSLPQMGRDLSGSQSIMSATVQLNVVIKAITGLFTASLSDRIGRRPALVTGHLMQQRRLKPPVLPMYSRLLQALCQILFRPKVPFSVFVNFYFVHHVLNWQVCFYWHWLVFAADAQRASNGLWRLGSYRLSVNQWSQWSLQLVETTSQTTTTALLWLPRCTLGFAHWSFCDF